MLGIPFYIFTCPNKGPIQVSLFNYFNAPRFHVHFPRSTVHLFPGWPSETSTIDAWRCQIQQMEPSSPCLTATAPRVSNSCQLPHRLAQTILRNLPSRLIIRHVSTSRMGRQPMGPLISSVRVIQDGLPRCLHLCRISLISRRLHHHHHHAWIKALQTPMGCNRDRYFVCVCVCGGGGGAWRPHCLLPTA